MTVADPLQRDQRRAGGSRSPQYTSSEICHLSIAEVRNLTREELISLIRAADVPLLRGETIEHLKYADRATLERLAFLSQRTVRNQEE
jgi:hypothetical protein